MSPINGIVSYLPVRLGEYVVPGIQNSTGSFLMTLSDMSVVTSEVKVDETDIVNVKIGQDADVTIDAVPGKVFKGKVTEIGSQAVRCAARVWPPRKAPPAPRKRRISR